MRVKQLFFLATLLFYKAASNKARKGKHVCGPIHVAKKQTKQRKKGNIQGRGAGEGGPLIVLRLNGAGIHSVNPGLDSGVQDHPDKAWLFHKLHQELLTHTCTITDLQTHRFLSFLFHPDNKQTELLKHYQRNSGELMQFMEQTDKQKMASSKRIEVRFVTGALHFCVLQLHPSSLHLSSLHLLFDCCDCLLFVWFRGNSVSRPYLNWSCWCDLERLLWPFGVGWFKIILKCDY